MKERKKECECVYSLHHQAFIYGALGGKVEQE